MELCAKVKVLFLMLNQSAKFLLACLFFIFSMQHNVAFGQAASTVVKEAQVVGTNTPLTTLETGQSLQYRVQWNCSLVSTPPNNCGSFELTDPLPDGFIFESCTVSSSRFNCTYDAGTNSATVELPSPRVLRDGDSINAIIVGRMSTDPDDYPGGIPSSITNTVTSTIGEVGVVPATSTVPLNPPTNNWEMTKTLSVPSPPTQPALDSNVVYEISICPNGPQGLGTGTIVLENPSLQEVCESNAVFVGATLNGAAITASGSCPNVSLDLPTEFDPADGCQVVDITLRYPDADFDIGDAVGNSANLDGDNITPGTCPNNCTSTAPPSTLAEPDPSARVRKRALRGEVGLGARNQYTITLNTNNSNVMQNNVQISDTFPTEISPISIAHDGNWSDPSVLANLIALPSNTVLVSNFDGTDGTSNGFSENVAGITGFRFVFTTPVPPGFNAGRLTIAFRADDPDLEIGDEFTNCATVTTDEITADASVRDPRSCTDVEIIEDSSDITLTKNMPGAIQAGVPFRTEFRLQHQNTSTEGAVNPVLVDCLSPELEFVSWDELDFRSGLDDPRNAVNLNNNRPLGVEPNLEVLQPGVTGNTCTDSNSTMLRWSWQATAPMGAFQIGGSQADTPVNNPFTFPIRPDRVQGGVRDNVGDATGPLGHSVRIDFDVTLQLKAGIQPAMNLPNNLQFTPENVGAMRCIGNGTSSVADANDIDGDSNTSEATCQTTDEFNVLSAAALGGEKFVGGSAGFPNFDPNAPPADNNLSSSLNISTPAYCPDDGMGRTRAPCVAQGNRGQAFNYRIRISNNGNVALRNYVAYDILPHTEVAGSDTGITEALSSVSRGSTWTPLLTGPLSLSSTNATVNAELMNNAIVQYSASTNPCRPELAIANDTTPGFTGWQSSCDDDWTNDPLTDTATFPAGYQSVRAWRLYVPFATDSWPPSNASDITEEDINVDVSMVAPLEAPSSDYAQSPPSLQIAWNNLGHRGSNAIDGSRMLTSEIVKSGIIMPPEAPVSIGSYVWQDLDGDGLQETGEPKISGALVELFVKNNNGQFIAASDINNMPIASITTTSSGLYHFENLPAGTYKVRVTPPSASAYGPSPTQTTNYDSNVVAAIENDSDIVTSLTGADAGKYESGEILLGVITEQNEADVTAGVDGDSQDGTRGSNEDLSGDMTVDFGFVEPMSLGSSVWEDTNGNGLQDMGEMLISGGIVTLLDGSGNPVTTDLSGATISPVDLSMTGGTYQFTNLPPGSYQIQISGVPSSFIPSPVQTTDNDDNTDNDSNIANEPSAGTYVSGTFILVNDDEPTGASETTPISSAADDADDADDGNGNMTIDFGFVRTLSVGSFIWNDNGGTAGSGLANNGLQDAGETGLAGAVVTLLDDMGDPARDVNGNVVAAQTTNADGLYYFSGLAQGDYKVQVKVPDGTGYQPSATQQATASNDVANDSNIAATTTIGTFATGGTYESAVFPLAYGAEPSGNVAEGLPGDDQDDTGDSAGNMTIDFGFYQPRDYGDNPDSYGTLLSSNGASHVIRENLSLGSLVLLDAELDGQPNAGATGDDAAGGADEESITMSTQDVLAVTNSMGAATNSYTLKDVSVTNVTGSPATLVAYIDFNGDGDFDDAGEESAPITVSSMAGAQTIPLINFSGIAAINAGETAVRLRLSTDAAAAGMPAGPAPDGEVEDHRITVLPVVQTRKVLVNSATNMSTNVFDLTAGSEMLNGAVNGGATGFSPFEPGMANPVTISEVASGMNTVNYISSVVCRDGGGAVVHTGAATQLMAGGTSSINSSVLTATSSSAAHNTFTCTYTNTEVTQIAFIKNATPVDTTNFQFATSLLANPNSLPDGSTMFQLDGETVDSDMDTFTNVTTFELPGLTSMGQSQTYNVTETVPAGWKLNGIECIDTPVSGSAVTVTATPAQVSAATLPIEVNFGDTISCTFDNIELVNLGSMLWVDANNNGTQDAGESPISGAEVRLIDTTTGNTALDADGMTVATVTSSASGEYYFNNLLPGDYVVEVNLAPGVGTVNAGAGVTDVSTLVPSGVQQTNANNNVDTDSNIDISSSLDMNLTDQTYYSAVISLAGGDEPTNESMHINAVGETGNPGQMGFENNNGNMTLDFGFIQPVSIGSFIWQDTDGDGQQGAIADEPALAGAVVTLLDGSGNAVTDLAGVMVNSVTVGSDGQYYFDNLPQGNYIVQVVAPTGYLPSVMQNGGDDAIANDSNIDTNVTGLPANTYRTGVINIGVGAEAVDSGTEVNTGDDQDGGSSGTADDSGNMTVDFGFVRPVSIGSAVWQDSNGDGEQDAGEPLMNQGMVTLLDGNGNPVTTDINGVAIGPIDLSMSGGTYVFDDLPPGDYQIQVTGLASGFVATPQQTITNNDDTESDSNIASEPSAGTYVSGTFTVQFGTEPTGTDETSDVAAAGDAADNSADSDGNMTVDFGFIHPVSIGSYVWEDVDVDGLQDVGESGVAGAQVSLFIETMSGMFVQVMTDRDGMTFGSAGVITTGAGGLYQFGNLNPGNYKVRIAPPVSGGYVPTRLQDASDNGDEDDSNIDISASGLPAGSYESPIITLTSSGEYDEQDTMPGVLGDAQDGTKSSVEDLSGNMTVDFGFVAPMSVGSLVWEDSNADGTQDANEPPIAGAEVVLLVEGATGFQAAVDINGNPIAAITTGSDGLYLFNNLPNGTYKVQVTPPQAFYPSPVQGNSSDDAIETDSNIAGEVTTGTYESVEFELDSATEVAESGQGRGDNQDDSGVDQNGNMTVDFGFVQRATIGNFVWLDLDKDGLQDANEEGIAGVQVQLTPPAGIDLGAGAGNPITTTTGPNGEYLFPNLPPVEGYEVTVISGVPTGLAPTFDEDDGVASPNQSSGLIDLSPDEEHLTADFGYAPPDGSLGDTIWVDANDDGIQNAGEVGIAGVAVIVTPPAGVDIGAGAGNPVTVFTDANGKYLVSGLPLGQPYLVEVDMTTLPPGYMASSSGLGDPDVRDGITTPAELDNATTVVLTSDDPINLDADFGYLPAADVNNSIGNIIWRDVDEDGNGPAGAGDGSDASEVGIAGVTVTLIRDNGDGVFNPANDSVVATSITDSNGEYLFTGLPDGDYIVLVTDQNNVLSGTSQTVDFDDAANPGSFVASTPNASFVDDLGVGVNTPVTELAQDFGYVEPKGTNDLGSIGDTIFFDENGSGGPDAGEGIEGVKVSIYGPGPDGVIGGGDDVLLGTTTTDQNGMYLFTGLDTSDTGPDPGTEYQIIVDVTTLPNGSAGWANTVDPNTNNLGDNESVTSLTAAEPIDLAQDFGYQSEVNNTLGGTIWPDTDGDGEQDESGVFSGVTVEIRDTNGNVVRKVTTDSQGNYEVMNLPDGIYTIVVTDENNILGGFVHTDSPNGTSDKTDGTSKDDTGYVVDLDSSGTNANPVRDDSGDFGYEPQVTTPISLGSFIAEKGSDGGVLFQWSTQTEVANLGFNFYGRVEGQWIQLNESLVLGQGDSVTVQSYTLHVNSDATVFALSDIDVTGKETLHGPFMLGKSYGVVAERQSIDWQSNQSERSRQKADQEAQRLEQQRQRSLQRKQKQSNQQINDQETSMLERVVNKSLIALLSMVISPAHAVDDEALVNLRTTKSGIHQISVRELTDFGVDIEGLPADELALKNAGNWVPIDVTGPQMLAPESTIRFVAHTVDTLYTDTNVYTLWFNASSALRMQQDNSVALGNAAVSYLASQKIEPQLEYSFTSPNADDPWYYERMVAIGKPTSKQILVPLKDVAVGGNVGTTKAKLQVGAFGGINFPGASKDHNIKVSFNGKAVAEQRFDGLSAVQVQSTLSDVKDGNNVVTVTLPMDTGYAYDAVNLDKVVVHYPRKFIAEDNRIQFESTFGKFRIRGFSANALSNGKDDLIALREDENGVHSLNNVKVYCDVGGCIAQTPGTNKLAQYYVSSVSAAHSPSLSALPLEDDIVSGQANYLIISHPAFIGAEGQYHLENLAIDLQSEMGSVDIVDVESIYAQFGDHLFDPQAIRSYIKYANANRGTNHVLLVGGDVYDYRRFENEDAESFIPSIYASTGNNITFAPTDAIYVDLDDDNVPDLPIARLPVRTAQELGVLVKKRQDYLSRQYTGKVLLVADEYDEIQQYDFAADANEVEAAYLQGFAIEKAYVDQLGSAAARNKVIQNINTGTSMTAFFGHSSTNQWSFNGLFTGPDAARLSNEGKPTVVTQWGCWNAYYVSPREDSMGHRFMMEGDRGAVVVMGSSTLTNANNERKLARMVFERLANGESLGEAVTNAKQNYAQDNPDHLDVLLGWTVLGFPELVIQ